MEECVFCGMDWEEDQMENGVCAECRNLSHFERAWLAATRDLTKAIVKFDETLRGIEWPEHL